MTVSGQKILDCWAGREDKKVMRMKEKIIGAHEEQRDDWVIISTKI